MQLANKGFGKTSANGVKNQKLIDTENVDYQKKILHASWHPAENIVAIAATNNLFIYSAASNSSSAQHALP